MFYFHPYLGKIPILTNIFQMGWNHQPDNHGGLEDHVPVICRFHVNLPACIPWWETLRVCFDLTFLDPIPFGCQPKNRGFPPNHPIFNRVFHYFPHPFWGFSPISVVKIGPLGDRWNIFWFLDGVEWDGLGKIRQATGYDSDPWGEWLLFLILLEKYQGGDGYQFI